jgi:DNA-binding Lrp family transcriptional regulator
LTDLDFQKKILEILKKEGGCIVGVRQLQKKVNCSPSTINKYLKIMTELRLIKLSQEKNKHKICIRDLDFEREFKKNTKVLEKLETQMYRKDLSEDEKLFLIGNYLKMALHHYHNHDVSLLFAENIQTNNKRIEIIKASKNKIWENMQNILLRLEENSRINILNSLFNVYEIPESLDEYKKNKYIPSKKEITKQKRLEEKKRQKEYEKYQKFCQICGKKNPPLYKEGAKHRQKHGEMLFAIIKHGGWHCQYCGKKLPLDEIEARKHQCQE